MKSEASCCVCPEPSRSALPAGYKGDRSHSTAIYLLLPEGQKSLLHRILSDPEPLRQFPQAREIIERLTEPGY
ncbi:MAG: hypothetical protein HY611_06040 [Elusimicrobia bacterium]|nr:hypothetical protein [Elusimicrobiota bacterium]